MMVMNSPDKAEINPTIDKVSQREDSENYSNHREAVKACSFLLNI
jgi:hypothetical protein